MEEKNENKNGTAYSYNRCNEGIQQESNSPNEGATIGGASLRGASTGGTSTGGASIRNII